AIRAQIDPAAAGLIVRDVRAEGLAASQGATDFGEYFTYFSVFLVISAVMLAVLFFRLGVEQRAREIGLLRAVGYTNARVRRLFTAEGVVLALAGSAIGVAAAVAYGGAMMVGLRTWWSGAVGTTLLRLHVSPVSLAVGAAGALVSATLCIAWTLGGLSRLSERSLLAGGVAPHSARRRSRLRAAAASTFALLGMILTFFAITRTTDPSGLYFAIGASLLVAGLAGVDAALRHPPRSVIGQSGWRSLWRVGVRNATDRPG